MGFVWGPQCHPSMDDWSEIIAYEDEKKACWRDVDDIFAFGNIILRLDTSFGVSKE